MGLNLVYSVLILFSVVSLYHARTCDYGYYCPTTVDCRNTSHCQEGICPADEDTSNMTESCDTGPDTPPGKPKVLFSMSSFSISETNREAQLELMLDKPLNCCTVSVKVQFEESVTGIIAKAGDDFVIPESGYVEVVFTAGQTKASFKVAIENDNIYEEGESFSAVIMPVSVPYGVELGTPRSAVVVILDDDDVVEVEFLKPVLEVDENDGQVKIEAGIVNGKTSLRDITVLVEPTANTATGCDYDNKTQRLIIPAGEQNGSITIDIFEDDIYEFPEIFKVAFVKNSFTPSHYGKVNGNGASITINDNEGFNYAGFEQSLYIIKEDNTSFMPMMKLDRPPPCCITIRAKLVDYNSTESHGFDADAMIFNYTFLTDEMHAYPDANASILFSHDDVVEDHTAFYIDIINQSLPYGFKRREKQTHGNSSAKATILFQDDDNYVRFSPKNYTVDEDLGPVNVTLQLHKPALEEITIHIHPIPLSATGQGVDFEGQRYYCTFKVNDKECTFAIDIVDDSRIEDDNETFRLDIAPTDYPANFRTHNPITTFVTIVDDDFTCGINNNMEEITVMEGENLDLNVYLSRQYREEIDVHYEFIHTSNASLGEDFNFSTDHGQLDFHHMITLYTLSDSVIESDEIIEIRVEINTKKPVYCSTTVRIVDDNTCNFNQSEYEIEEGDKVYLDLTFTKALPLDVDIIMDYNYTESTTDEDFNPKLLDNVTLDGGKKVVRIPITTKLDTLLEDNESFEVTATPPSDSGLSCKTKVTIIDNNMCRFDQELYNVTEGGKHAINLVLRLDKPLPEPIDVELQYDRGQIEIQRPKRKIQDVVHFRTIAYNDRLLHPYQQHTITARLPGGRMCSTKLGIIDDDTMSIFFRKPQYKPDNKNDVLRHRPEWIIMGRTGFVFNVTILEVDATATGHNPGEPKEMKDFERRDHHITITPAMTRTSYYYDTLPLDIIDDDIVEMREEYYSLNIYDDLPDGVTIGKHFPSTRVVIKDDDETTISLQDYKVKLSKGIYKDIRLHFTFKDGNPPVDLYLSATETSMDLPGSKDNIKKIIAYFPEELKGCGCIYEYDNENKITIMYEKS